MRKAGRVHASVEKFSIFRAQHSIEEADVVVQIIDAEQGPSDQDKKIAAMIQEARKGCVLLVNKWDLAQAQFTEDQYRQALLKALFFLSSVPVIFASAKSGLHIRKTIETIDYVARQVQTNISTGVLNRVLHDAFKRVSPPSAHGRFLKFYYAVQTGIQPVRISLFVNNTSYCAPAYRNYLMGRMREAFGLEGAPLVLQLRSSHEESSTGVHTANKPRRAVRGRTS
jgi:GTP-binding protein